MQVLKPVCSVTEMATHRGEYFDIDATWTIGSEGAFYREDGGTLIAHILPNAISPDLIRLAEECYMRVGKMVSSNRGSASGARTRTRIHELFDRSPDVHSGIMGYIDNTSLRRPCRLTQFSKDHFDQYARGLPFVHKIDECFRETCPSAYQLQREEAKKTAFHIEGTAFSTVTVNYNFRTALHKDNGDFRQGFGNLVVCQHGISGGYVLFPRYKLAITLRSGDFLAMDVHEYHCNSPIELQSPDGYRLSFVCYLREHMTKCEEVNARIEMMHQGQRRSTNDWIQDIFHAFGEEVPEKHSIGTSNNGLHTWWELRGQQITMRYKNKRYTCIDAINGVVIHQLAPAWEYAVNSRHQSPSDDGSYRAQ
jgi:hypothetical protein